MAVIVDQYYLPNHCICHVDIDGTTVSVTVTSAASVFRKWISTTLFLHRQFLHDYSLVVGLGVQWTPYAGPDPPADTLQLCVGRRCLIFQLAYAGAAPKILRDFLMNQCVTFVGFWNHSDRRKLEMSGHRLTMCSDPVDLRLHAETEYGESLASASVNQIVQECLGFGVDQSTEISMSNWYEEFLREEQVLYACVHAHCAYLIGKNYGVWRYSA